MSKLFFFDIDGTLIDCNKGLYGISKVNRQSFDQLKQNGHDVFLATGRCKCFITEGVMDYPFSGYVTCNGGYVEYKGEPIYKAVVPAKAIEETIKLSKEHHFSFYFESSDYIYVLDKNDPQHKEFARVWGMKDETIIDDFDPREIETYIGMIVVNSKEDIPLLVETLSPYFDIQRHQTGCSFDLTLKGVSKAVGIQKLVEALHKDIKDTIAFGDSMNDYQMIEKANQGIVFEGAKEKLLDIAYDTFKDPDQDGIALSLEKLGLI